MEKQHLGLAVPKRNSFPQKVTTPHFPLAILVQLGTIWILFRKKLRRDELYSFLSGVIMFLEGIL